jgi:hypothetical protein
MVEPVTQQRPVTPQASNDELTTSQLFESQTATTAAPHNLAQPPDALTHYKVSRQLDRDNLLLEKQSGPKNSPQTIAMTEREYGRTNREGIVPIDWSRAQALPNKTPPPSAETELAEHED